MARWMDEWLDDLARVRRVTGTVEADSPDIGPVFLLVFPHCNSMPVCACVLKSHNPLVLMEWSSSRGSDLAIVSQGRRWSCV